MMDRTSTLLYTTQFLYMGALLIVGLFLLGFILSGLGKSEVQAKRSDALVMEMSDSPNVVTSSLATTMSKLGQTIDSTGDAINDGLRSAGSVAAQGGLTIARATQTGVTTAARGVGSGLAFVGRGVSTGTRAVLDVPGNMLGFVSNTSMIRAVIRPSDSDHIDVPIIDPNSPELRAALLALPPVTANQATAQPGAGPVWPMHGEITTHFGVDHRPYQRTHTGIDISDRRPAGVTPIKPFRPGRVVETVHSRYGLGNHVIVDHGNGVTSVYAHLNSISVQVGQEVTLESVLGFEGTTGLSTGTHLHFEIRVNGQAADPRQFISGLP